MGWLTIALAFAGESLAVDPGSALSLEGESTLHHYAARAEGFDVAIDVAPGDLATEIRNGGLKSIDVRVPVAGLHSGTAALDQNMKKALRMAEHPDIRFHMLTYVAAPGSALEIDTHGTLEVAGVTRPIDLALEASPIAGGLRLTGRVHLLMSDFEIDPPVFMGVLHTADGLDVRFDLVVHRAVLEPS